MDSGERAAQSGAWQVCEYGKHQLQSCHLSYHIKHIQQAVKSPNSEKWEYNLPEQRLNSKLNLKRFFCSTYHQKMLRYDQGKGFTKWKKKRKGSFLTS